MYIATGFGRRLKALKRAEERRNGFQVRKVVHKMPDPDIKQALVKPDANFADARPRMSRMARKSSTKQAGLS